MTQSEVILALVNAGLLKGRWAFPLDRDYSTLSVPFVREALVDWTNGLPPALTVLVDLGGGKTARRVRWEPESGDCDNIAADFITHLNRCMWLDAVTTGTPRGNVAGGRVFVLVRPGDMESGHALVWWLDHAGTVHHCDPATHQVDHLTPEQWATNYGGDYA